MVSVLRTLQAEWNALVPQAQTLGIRRVRTLNLPLETIDYRRGKLDWLRSEIARLTATSALTSAVSLGADLSVFTFGVELEFILGPDITREGIAARLRDLGIACSVERYNHQTGPHWKITTDGSVDPTYTRGFEIVSPILQGDAGFEVTRKVCDVLKETGCKISKKCGLHVHLGANDWELSTFKNIMLLYSSAEQYIDSFMAPSRRGPEGANGFAKALRVNPTLMRAANNMDDVARACGQSPGRSSVRNPGRYYKVNLQSYWEHGTIEFRHHQGTVEADKVINWVKLCMRMAIAARQGTAVANSFDEFFSAVQSPDDEKAFFQGRADFFRTQLSRNAARANSLLNRARREGTVRTVFEEAAPFDQAAIDLQRRSTTRGQI